MSAKQLFIAGALCAVCWAPVAVADEPAPAGDGAAADAINHKIDELSSQLDALEQAAARIKQIRNDPVQELMNKVGKGSEKSVVVNRTEGAAEAPAPAPADGAEGAASTAASLEEQWKSIQARLDQLDNVIRQTSDIRTGDLAQLRKELGRVTGRTFVARAVPPAVTGGQGRLVINNLSGLNREVTVNGIAYTFAPGKWQVPVVAYQDVITASAGDVTRLWGRSYWRESANGPEMRLDIR